jgi:hypothetical protein
LDNKIILQLIIKKLQAGATVKISVCYWTPGRKSVLQEKAEYLMEPGTPLIIPKLLSWESLMAWCGRIPQIQEVRFSHKGNNEDVKETQEENCFQKLNEI